MTKGKLTLSIAAIVAATSMTGCSGWSGIKLSSGNDEQVNVTEPAVTELDYVVLRPESFYAIKPTGIMPSDNLPKGAHAKINLNFFNKNVNFYDVAEAVTGSTSIKMRITGDGVDYLKGAEKSKSKWTMKVPRFNGKAVDFLDFYANQTGLKWAYDKGEFVFYYLDTKVFDIKGAVVALGQSTAIAEIANIISDKGSINQPANSPHYVAVTDTAESLDVVEARIKKLNKLYTSEMEMDVKVYLVDGYVNEVGAWEDLHGHSDDPTEIVNIIEELGSDANQSYADAELLSSSTAKLMNRESLMLDIGNGGTLNVTPSLHADDDEMTLKAEASGDGFVERVANVHMPYGKSAVVLVRSEADSKSGFIKFGARDSYLVVVTPKKAKIF